MEFKKKEKARLDNKCKWLYESELMNKHNYGTLHRQMIDVKLGLEQIVKFLRCKR
jgi:hypothetical protein